VQLGLLDSLPGRPEAAFAGARRLDLGQGAWVELVPGWVAAALPGSTHLELFERLLGAADWERHRRQMYDRVVDVPRLVANLPGEKPGVAWNGEDRVELLRHKAPSREVRAVGDQLRLLAIALSHRYQRTLTHITLAYYRDGQDSVAYHGDRLGPLRSDTVVAVLSVGARRRFLLRPSARHPAAQPELPGLRGELGGGVPLGNDNGPARGPLARELEEVRSTAARDRQAHAFSVGEGDLLVMGGTCQETWEHAVPKVRDAGPRIAIQFREHPPTSVRRSLPPPPGPKRESA
jgi:alkylated DNA repair dioxygenase AlkB